MRSQRWTKVYKLRTTVPCVILRPDSDSVLPTDCVVSMSQCLAWNREGVAAGRAHGDPPVWETLPYSSVTA